MTSKFSAFSSVVPAPRTPDPAKITGGIKTASSFDISLYSVKRSIQRWAAPRPGSTLNYCVLISGHEFSVMASKGQEMCESCHDFPKLVQALKNARMFEAVSDKHLDCLKAAIDAGADVNEYDEPTGTRKIILDGLNLANELGYDDDEVLLTVAKNDSDINDPPQETALVLAVEDDWSAGVEILIKSGADVNKPDTFGRTPLIVAVENGKDEFLEVLIQARADVNVKQKLYDDVMINSNYLWNMRLEMRPMIGRTALMHAANKGNIRYVELLLKAGADVNIVQTLKLDFGELTFAAVSYAAISRSMEVFNLLIDAEADVAMCYLHETSLEILHKLLEAGIKVNKIYYGGRNALNQCIDHPETNEKEKQIKKIEILHAAGETLSRSKAYFKPWTPNLWKYQTDELNLMSICREFIREHLLQMSQVNLFYNIPRLGLPAALCNYLLYKISLYDDEEEEEE